MPADANVFSQIRPFQAPDTVNQLAKVLQVQAMQDEAGVNRLKMQQVQQGMADQNRLRDLLSKDYANPQDRESALLKGGFVDQAGKLSKDRRESAKVEAETGKLNVEAVANRAKLYAPQWANVQSPQQAAQLVTQMHNDQAFAGTPMTAVPLETKLANIPADPAQFAQWRQQMSVGSEKFAELMAQRRGQDITMRGQDLTADTTRRGQDLTYRSAQEGRAQSERHFQANQSTPQYMETDAGLVALPKRLPNGAQPVGTPVAGPDGQPLGKPLKPIPPSVNSAIIQNTQSMNQVDRALALLDGKDVGTQKGDTNATGVKAYLPQAVLNRMDPQGVDARAEISDIGSLKIHDRSGAAVTISESPRLMPFIPLTTDDAATVKKKLTRLRTEIVNEANALSQTYSKDQGYRPSPVVPAASGAAGFPSSDAIEAELKRRAGKK